MGIFPSARSETGLLADLDLTSRDVIGWLLVLPGLLLFSMFMVYPIAMLVYISLTDATTPGTVVSGDTSFVGLANYAELLSDRRFWNSMFVTWLYLAVSLAIKIVLAVGLAIVLTHSRVKGKRYMRAIVIVPMGFPAIFTISIWRAMFSGARFGPINEFLSMYNGAVTSVVGVVDTIVFFATVNAPSALLADVPVGILSNRWTAFMAYVTTEVWLAYPFMVIIIVSALQDVPGELHDAAKVDGAGYLHRFVNVTFPSIRGPVIFASILTAATSFQNILIPWVLNRGGPSRQNELVLVYGYREAIIENQFALASSIMTIAIIVIGLFMVLAVRKTDIAEGAD
ncbi:carbohydrate ABC transporter permease [Natronorubrum halophilum]|uniref:carbohydrate ABC transporter permease n=1 Tax=Natronorubrum halophilum TaxID=1702106 RepID=UPI0010C162A9|nr:sugar ABC transporter permease [Natronorubrum halophilum]